MIGTFRHCGRSEAIQKTRGLWIASSLALLAMTNGEGALAACENIAYQGALYSVCSASATDKGLRTFLHDDKGEHLGSFSALERHVAARGERLVFAMNGGMYHADRRPVGLYVENGRAVSSLNRLGGPGNFHMRPNGVFWIDAKGAAHVTETSRFAAMKAKPLHATQSGPMLVIGGAIHPKFRADSDSLKIRNGVGLCDKGQVRFAISDAPVTFSAFALFFRDRLGCADALYLDGSISALHAPEINRSDLWRPEMGPMIALVAKR